MKTKGIMLTILMLLVGVMVAGGTYAFLTIQANVTNTNYVGVTKCFLVDYNINNSDNTQDITGTLFPSIGPSGGLSGRVGLKTSSSCDVNGIGTLKLSVASTTASHLTEIATSHCEDKKTGDILTTYATQAACSTANQKWVEYPTNYCESNSTLEILKNVTTASDCIANNGTWVTSASDKTPLKYAVYSASSAGAIPVSVGKIRTSDIGNDIVIHDNFIINSTQRYYYVYIWLDGYLTDNTYIELPFGGNIKAEAIQNGDAYNVTFDANGGTVNISEKVVIFGSTYGDLPTPTREGYTFKGWHGSNIYNPDTMTISNTSHTAGSEIVQFNANIYDRIMNKSQWVPKTNTTYTIVLDIIQNTFNQELRLNTDNRFYILQYGNKTIPAGSVYTHITTFTTRSNFSSVTLGSFWFWTLNTVSGTFKTKIAVFEGTTIWAYEPYYILNNTEVVQNSDHTLTAIWKAN